MFLFFRYRPEVYWYPLVHLIHSLLISLVPIIPDPVIQIILLEIIFFTHIVLTLQLMPWRLWLANIFELVFTICTLALASMSAFFISPDNMRSLAWVCVVLILIMFAVSPVGIA